MRLEEEEKRRRLELFSWFDGDGLFWSVYRFERARLGIYNILAQRNPSQDSSWIDAIASRWPLCAVVASVLPLHMLMRGGIVGSKALRCSA